MKNCMKIRVAICAALLVSVVTLASAGEPDPTVGTKLVTISINTVAAPAKTPDATPSISDQGTIGGLISYKAKAKCPAEGSCTLVRKTKTQESNRTMEDVATTR